MVINLELKFNKLKWNNAYITVKILFMYYWDFAFLTPCYQNNSFSFGTKPEDPNNTVLLIHLDALYHLFSTCLWTPTYSQTVCIFSSLYAEFVMSVTVADSSWPAHAYLTPQPACHSERAQSRLCQDHERKSRNIYNNPVKQYSCRNLREKQHHPKNQPAATFTAVYE